MDNFYDERIDEITADINAEILTEVEDVIDSGKIDDIMEEKEILTKVIFEAVDNYLLQFNGKCTRHDIFSDDEIFNLISYAEDEYEVVETVASAVANYLIDNKLA